MLERNKLSSCLKHCYFDFRVEDAETQRSGITCPSQTSKWSSVFNYYNSNKIQTSYCDSLNIIYSDAVIKENH